MDPEAPLEIVEPPQLKFLRRLVTTLTAVMIIGLLTIVALLVIRLLGPQTVDFPDGIALPQGVTPTAYTHGNGWYAIVSDDNQILIYDAKTGALADTITVTIP